jgi:UDP-N-acetylglucosamine diphosphorylase/glucosamine-1-phosphate N-acetyltransferase
MRGFFLVIYQRLYPLLRNIILFDDEKWDALLPLTFTKPISELRIGILTISEKWAHYLKGEVSYITQDYLSEKYPINISADNYVINSRLLPNKKIVSLIKGLELNDALLIDNTFIAARLDNTQFEKLIEENDIEELNGTLLNLEELDSVLIDRPYHIFQYNGREIQRDFKLLTDNKVSAAVPESVRVMAIENTYISSSAKLSHCIINAENGPVYIGKNVEIMEGAVIRGPFAACDNSVVKMSAKIYGDTTIGPYSKVGGELNNVVIQGYSNKSHDGFLGNAVIGEWCNLGADTNNSNLKNNYSEVKLWDYPAHSFTKTGLQFCGLIMGDHSKCGINTMFNTGTVVGVCANIFGSGYPRNFIPSFSWGGRDGFQTNSLKKAKEVADIVMKRRQIMLTQIDQDILQYIFDHTDQYRNWES